MRDGVAMEIAARNTVVYRCLPCDPAAALLLGNGHLGAAVRGLEGPCLGLHLTIARCDTWDQQTRLGAIALIHLVCEDLSSHHPARCALNLATAMLEIRVHAEGEAAELVKLRLRALRGTEAMLIEIDDPRARRWRIEVIPTREEDRWMNQDGVAGVCFVNPSSEFDEVCRRAGLDPGAHADHDPLRGRAWALAASCRGASNLSPRLLRLPASTSHQIHLATSCTRWPDHPEDEVLNQVRASPEQTQARVAAHETWWRDFWSRAWVDLHSAGGDAEYEERLWYVALYHLASGGGGAYPMRFNGGPWLLDGNQRFWDRGYWFQNMRFLYWPMLYAGDPRTLRDFVEWYMGNAPFVRAQTRALFPHAAGLTYPETQLPWGGNPDVDVGRGTHNPSTWLHLCQGLELCLLMERLWQATGDDAFFFGRCWPLMRDLLAFYLSLLSEGEDGRCHLQANALETFRGVVDPMPDMAGLWYLLPRAAEWSRRAGEPDEVAQGYRRVMARLAPPPVGWCQSASRSVDGIHTQDHLVSLQLEDTGHYLPAGGLVGGVACERHNMENPELYALWPWGLAGADSAEPTRRRAELTWHHRTWRHLNNGWAQDVMQAARLGWGDEAGRLSLEHASRHQRFPNGCFISPAAAHFHGLLTANPYFDSAGVHALGIAQMLLQDHDGILRIAPATPRHWSGTFRLHAAGGFAVEATIRFGQPVKATLIPTRPNAAAEICNVAASPARIEDTDHSLAPGERLDLPADRALRLTWPDHEGLVPREDARPDIVWPGYKATPPPVASRRGHWHDESIGHGQIGLDRDGLYPATRR